MHTEPETVGVLCRTIAKRPEVIYNQLAALSVDCIQSTIVPEYTVLYIAASAQKTGTERAFVSDSDENGTHLRRIAPRQRA
ncbi:hypothetical protein J6590_052708 [Homalodisca vitripennis]|nr:hypothetical protein J6590_052708 [Homalodisca vitripennis]